MPPTHNEVRGPEVAKHRDASTLGRIAKALDHLTTIVTADLIVNVGVLLTGLILCLFESGAVARPWEHHDPQEVVVVRSDAVGVE